MSCVTDWIQAISALGVAILTGITLPKIYEYTRETRRIRNATVAQMNASQRPFFVVGDEMSSAVGKYIPVIKNQGDGPALDVVWKIGIENEWDDGRYSPNAMWQRLGAIGRGDSSAFDNPVFGGQITVLPMAGLRVHFRDMAGNWYWMTCKLVNKSRFTDSGELTELCHADTSGN